MFDKSLQDLIKGIRHHKRDPSTYISKAIVEIRKDLQSTDKYLKYVAVQKATYLKMLGIDVDFATFHIVEVMSSPLYRHRRAGMLAACQIFNAETDVILLCTNLFKNQLHNPDMYETGTAMNCLSNVATKELARDLLEDVAILLNSTRPFVRKKAVLVLYKLYLKYPQGLPQTFDRLRQRLDDPDMSVVSCTVNVICELSRKNPKNFLALAPQLFQLLITSENNWMLIKIVKLMSALLPEEPRLARKLLDPLVKIVQETNAKSLLYESIHAITKALVYTVKPDGSQPKIVPGVVNLCTEKLQEFVKDPDQNLKYLGLAGFVNLMHSHPRVVAEHKEMVLRCLMDDDVTVRLRALELLTGMVTKRNLMDIVQKLLEHVQTAESGYRDNLIEKIVFVCSREKYSYLTNFAWYISVLVDLAHMNGAPKGTLIHSQLVDVVVRVPSVRPFAVRAMYGLILDRRLALRRSSSDELDGISHILFAACWISGEFAHLLEVDLLPGEVKDETPFTEKTQQVVEAMLSQQTHEISSFAQAAYVHNVMKLVNAVAQYEFENHNDEFGVARFHEFCQFVGTRLENFVVSELIQVQERAVTGIELLTQLGLYKKDGGICATQLSLEQASSLLSLLFKEPIKPVSAEAQAVVPVPENFDLEEPLAKLKDKDDIPSGFSKHSCGALRVSFRDPAAVDHFSGQNTPHFDDSEEDSDDEELLLLDAKKDKKKKKKGKKNKKKYNNPRNVSDPFYLTSSNRHAQPYSNNEDSSDDELEIPSVRLDDPSLKNLSRSSAFVSSARMEGPTINSLYAHSIHNNETVAVLTDDALPEGAQSRKKKKKVVTRGSEDITLADIELVQHEHGDIQQTVSTKEKKESKKKRHSKEKKKKKKKKSRQGDAQEEGDLLDLNS